MDKLEFSDQVSLDFLDNFLLREERIDALLESAQTQSYNTAMELGQRGIRFVFPAQM